MVFMHKIYVKGVFIMMPSVAELTYFFEVSNTLNLSQAAKNLAISQPALSRAIQNLESTVGTSLLVRHPKGVKLTPAGHSVFLQIKSMLQHWQDIQSEALSFHHQVQGMVKIGCPSSVGLFMHGMLKALLDKHKDLDLELIHDASELITQAVIDFKLDIGIVSHPVHYPDLIIRKLGESDFTLWVAKGYENSDEAVLICNPSIPQTELLLQECKAQNISFKRLLKINSQEVAASLTANGCGVGVLTSCFTKTLYAKYLEPLANAPVIKNELYLIYRKECLAVKATNAVLNMIKEWSKLV
jgi:DNA-binding transcriptional LysR family regulator